MELLILKLSETLLRFRRAKGGSLAVPVARQASVRCNGSCIGTSEHRRIIGPRQQKSRTCVLRIGGAFKQQSRRSDVAERQHFFCACQQRCQCFGIERFQRGGASRAPNLALLRQCDRRSRCPRGSLSLLRRARY